MSTLLDSTRYFAVDDDIVCITDLHALWTQPYRTLLSVITKEVRCSRRGILNKSIQRQ